MIQAPPLRVLLIDDHALFREGLALLLQQVRPGVVPQQAAHFDEALDWLNRHGAADLALVDLTLPGLPGLQGLQLLRERWSLMPAVALSSDDRADTITAALDSGAMGFISKGATPAELSRALDEVLRGGVYLPDAYRLGSSGQGSGLQRQPTEPARSAALRDLAITPRQSDVLRLILRGLPTKLICRELGLAEGTVKSHTAAVLRALDVTTRTQAVIAASRLGLRWDD